MKISSSDENKVLSSPSKDSALGVESRLLQNLGEPCSIRRTRAGEGSPCEERMDTVAGTVVRPVSCPCPDGEATEQPSANIPWAIGVHVAHRALVGEPLRGSLTGMALREGLAESRLYGKPACWDDPEQPSVWPRRK